MRELIKKIMPKQLIDIYKSLRYIFIAGMFWIFRIKPINKRLVVLCNVWGFGDNAKYVALELLKRKKEKNIDIVFIANNADNSEIPQGIKVLKTNSVSAIYALSTACVWVECNRKEAYIRKRKKQFYIQTWHGGIPLKKIEGDCSKYLGEEYIKRAKKDSAMTDLYVSNGGFCTQMYRRAFWYKGKIIECGTPRNDILIDISEERIKRTREKLKIPKGLAVAVYAPTYRTNGNTSAYIKNIKAVIKALEETFNKKYALVIRLHPLFAAKNKNLYNYKDNIINGNADGDMYSIMEAADVLITDYSNTMFEFAMTGKKVFLYTSDIKEYEDERGFYFDIKKLPFDTAENESELADRIRAFNQTKYLAKLSVFFEELQIYEGGNASKITADYIIDYIETYKK